MATNFGCNPGAVGGCGTAAGGGPVGGRTTDGPGDRATMRSGDDRSACLIHLSNGLAVDSLDTVSRSQDSPYAATRPIIATLMKNVLFIYILKFCRNGTAELLLTYAWNAFRIERSSQNTPTALFISRMGTTLIHRRAALAIYFVMPSADVPTGLTNCFSWRIKRCRLMFSVRNSHKGQYFNT